VRAELLQGFYLGDVFIEPLNGQVTGPGISEHLTPKASEVLLQLAKTPGSLVSRGALLAKVWGEGQGSPEALSHAVSEIRHALHDDPGNPRYIQTLPRRGYRLIPEPRFPDEQAPSNVIGASNGTNVSDLNFIQNLQQRGVLEAALAYLVLGWLLIQVADVVFGQLYLPRWAGTFVTFLVLSGFPVVLVLSWFLEYRDGKAVVDTGPHVRNPRQRFGRTYLSVVGALGVAAVMVFAYDRFIGLPVAVEPAPYAALPEEELLPVEPNSIAVLKFLNIDGSDQTEIFASGFAEEMINRLARLPGMSVASRGDAWSLGPVSSSSDVRRRLRVAYYVEGSVRLIGESLSVNVKLIDSETGFQLTSRTFDEQIEDFNRIQRDITNLTVANLRIALPTETETILDSMYEEADLDAYILYRRGKEMYERPRTIETITGAIQLYRQALSFDPDYAAAHAGLCSAHIDLYELSGTADELRQSESACAAALRSDSRMHMVYSALGDLRLRTGRLSEAEDVYAKALAINAQDVQAMSGLAEVYRRSQRLDEAEELLATAVSSQPGNWRLLHSLGGFHFNVGRYHEAANAYRQVVFLDPDNFQARSNLGSALIMAGEFEEGRRVMEESLEIEPIARTYSNLGVIYYYLGEFGKSVNMHREAVEQEAGLALRWLNLADSLHFAGRDADAGEAFGKAHDISERMLAVDPLDSEALVMRAWSEHMLGDSEAALASVERGLEIDPEDPYGHYYDALIRYQTGDEARALRALSTALDKGYPPGLLVAEPYLGAMRGNDNFHAIIVNSIE
jgi:tetratricopeptide (TPR) repeat protein/DNA-binding winged helix-turn-helix (wHTH) protein